MTDAPSLDCDRVWVHGLDSGPRSCVLGERLIIGRGDHCDLQLPDDTVSWDHAEITRHGTSYRLTDIGSRNGTLANGKQLAPSTRLSPGDVISIGPYRLELASIGRRSTAPSRTLSVEVTDEERAVAAALVAPYRAAGSFAARPATRREIAEQLHISESTVKRRINSLAGKLHVDPEAGADRPSLVADRILALGLDRQR